MGNNLKNDAIKVFFQIDGKGYCYLKRDDPEPEEKTFSTDSVSGTKNSKILLVPSYFTPRSKTSTAWITPFYTNRWKCNYFRRL